MAETKEAYLNESFYGPSIPPAQAESRPTRPTARNCSPYAVTCTVFKVITTVLIVLGIVVLILWLVFQPNDLKVYVDDATLARFDLAPNNTLYYNLTLAMSFRNPNKKVGIHYERIESMAFYDGVRFGYAPIRPFHQHRKSTAVIHPSFDGQGLLVGGSGAPAATYSREKGEGFFYVSVRLYMRVRLKMIVINSVEYRPEVDCFLRLPAPGNATSLAGGFTRTKCDGGSLT